MADPQSITPDPLEILVARDLRKAGLLVGRLQRRNLARADDESGDFRLALTTELTTPGSPRLLIACHRTSEPVDADVVERLAAGVAKERVAGADRAAGADRGAGANKAATEAGADGTPGRPVGGLLVATVGFSPGALTAAGTAGIALLRVADARASFDASGWGPRGHYPMWLPEYVLELAARDAAGLPSYAMLGQGDGARLLDVMGLLAG